MRPMIAFLALLLTGCPRPPAPVPPPPSAPYETCAATAPVSADVCPRRFTAEGLACVRCPGVAGCLDSVDQVYCVVGGCLDDPRCHEER